MVMAMNESKATRILRDMKRDREQTWGFFLPPLLYGNDTLWESFLKQMKGFAESTLLKPRSYNSDGDGRILPSKLGWNVQSGPSLNGCSKEEIWRRLRELMRSFYGIYDSTIIKHDYPIIVDKDSLDSVLEAPGPIEWRSFHTRDSTAQITVLDIQWFDLREAPEADEYLPEDEVGWTNVLAVKVHPRLYSMLQSGLWPQVVHCKPPEISRLP